MNKLLKSIENQGYNARVRTREGATAHASIRTGKLDAEGVLPFFTLAAGMRGDVEQAWSLFQEAWESHQLVAIRALFYLRYFRRDGVTGNGEREMFRQIFARFATRNDDVAASLVRHIPDFGRWDDVLGLLAVEYKYSAPKTREAVVSLITAQMRDDIRAYRSGKAVSLMAKWLPSENASSEESTNQARFLARRLGMRHEEYRNTLTKLREEIGIIETMITNGDFGKIDYTRVPAQAHRIHSKLFMQKDTARYQAYLDSVTKGTKKIHTTGLQAHQVTMAAMTTATVRSADVMWQDMLNQFQTELDVLVALDTSASMERGSFYGNRGGVKNQSPQEIATSLAAFFSEVNTGAFHRWIINFQTNAKMFKVRGETLQDRIRNLKGMNSDHGATNIHKMYELLLSHARSVNASEEDMPDVIMILSDMQFSGGSVYGWNGTPETVLENMRRQYVKAGYQMPVVIYWNVNALPDSSPIKADDQGVLMVNGFSQDVLRHILRMSKDDLRQFTPVGMMLSALTSEPYSAITLD